MVTVLRYAEDLAAGDAFDLGKYHVFEPEMIDFANRWDPQAFHLGHTAASTSEFGGVIASGVYTLAVFQRLAVLAVYRDWAIVAGRTIRQINLLRPVRGGDELTGSLIITGVTPRAGRALVTQRGILRCNQHEVMTLEVDAYLRQSGKDTN